MQRCIARFNTSYGEGYHAYFNDKEFRFAREIGGFWTNFASTGNPNRRGPHDEVTDGMAWPLSSGGGIVLDANLPSGHAIETELYNKSAICQLWDAMNGLKDLM